MFFLLIVLLPLFCLLELITWLCFALDEIIFPKYRKVQISAPLFIIGMPRTATTFLHQTLFSDSENFTSMKSWEILFAPSIVQKKLLNLLSVADRHCKYVFSKLLKRLDKQIFRVIEPAHPTSFFDIEEDEIILIHLFSYNFLVFLFPWIKHLRNLAWFDERLSERKKRMIMKFFRKCVQKHLYTYGKGRTYLSKSPSHTPKIKSLTSIFPDSRFICIFRQPDQAIPSTISLINHFLKMYGATIYFKRLTAYALNAAEHWYSYPLQVFKEWNSEDYLMLNYNSVVSNPEKSISEIYNHFGFSLSDNFHQKLAIASQKNSRYKSRHFYSASDFGLNEEEIRQRFNPLYEQYLKQTKHVA